MEEPWAKGYEFSDVMLHPDLSEFNAVAFWRGNEMYDIGYNTALNFIPKIKEDIERLTKNKK